MIKLISQNKVDKVVVLYKDRLLRFGYELVEYIASLYNCEIEIIDNTEKSEKNGKHFYIVHNLDAEMEDGEIYFGDMNDVIFNNQYALMGFLIDSIIDIKFEDKVTTIIFRSNSIVIEFVG